MLTALEQLPPNELVHRHERCRNLLSQRLPEAGGLLVSSRILIYYLTGTLGVGLVWLPLEGEPVLLVRKGMERAKLESPLVHIFPFKSYKEVPSLCAAAESPLSPVIAIDKNGLSWSMAEVLQNRLNQYRFLSGDAILTETRMLKTPWELNKLRLCGERHRKALDEVLPLRIHAGLSELQIAHRAAMTFFECGNSGLLRMNAYGEENFLGYVSAGDSGNYPTYYNGPLGCRGLHPAVPFLGDAGTIWKSEMLLSTDLGFNVEGYNTDKTQTYWSGSPSSIPDDLRRAHDVCIQIYEQITEELKPGSLPEELWNKAVKIANEAGQSEGFMGLGRDKVPFLGHGIGLAVDESPVFAAGFTTPLEAGMVVAIEPKIGIPGRGMTGVEHTLEITEKGARSLTGSTKQILSVS